MGGQMQRSTSQANMAAGAIAVTTILAWIVKQFGGIEIPGEVQGAITGVLSWAAVWLMPKEV